MKILVEHNVLTRQKKVVLPSCEHCVISKQRRLKLASMDTKSKYISYLIH